MTFARRHRTPLCWVAIASALIWGGHGKGGWQIAVPFVLLLLAVIALPLTRRGQDVHCAVCRGHGFTREGRPCACAGCPAVDPIKLAALSDYALDIFETVLAAGEGYPLTEMRLFKEMGAEGMEAVAVVAEELRALADSGLLAAGSSSMPAMTDPPRARFDYAVYGPYDLAEAENALEGERERRLKIARPGKLSRPSVLAERLLGAA